MGLTERERTGYIDCIDLSGTIYSEFINPGCESGYKISESHVALAYEASATHCNAYPMNIKYIIFLERMKQEITLKKMRLFLMFPETEELY